MKHLLADAASDRLILMDKVACLDFVPEVIRRSESRKGFEVQTRHWVVERMLNSDRLWPGWMTRCRRVVRDQERRIDVSQATILIALGGNLLLRNAHR